MIVTKRLGEGDGVLAGPAKGGGLGDLCGASRRLFERCHGHHKQKGEKKVHTAKHIKTGRGREDTARLQRNARERASADIGTRDHRSKVGRHTHTHKKAKRGAHHTAYKAEGRGGEKHKSAVIL